MRNATLLLVLLCAGLGSAPGARATVLRGLDLGTLCDRSEHVLRGEVVRLEPAWRGGRIVTAVTLRVAETLAGPRRAGDRVTFWQLGGEVGGVGQRVVGAAQFRRGEQVIVFLHRRAAGLFVTGMVQGKVRVLAPSAPGGEARVVSAVGRFPLRGGAHPLAAPTTLRGFTARVRARIRATRRPSPGRQP